FIALHLFSRHTHLALPYSHSFPTRRSSDLRFPPGHRSIGPTSRNGSTQGRRKPRRQSPPPALQHPIGTHTESGSLLPPATTRCCRTAGGCGLPQIPCH